MMFQTILVCSDGSEPSLSAAEVAADMAKTHRAELTLLHVCQLPTLETSFPGAPTLSGSAIDAYVQDMHTAVIRRTLPLIKQSGVCCDILEETGNPADVIARVANQQGFDLIIMGSRGVSKEKADKLGSVCHRVIHDASCPVLIVR
jgi:nucleotide-binding universal stress UspA family protein